MVTNQARKAVRFLSRTLHYLGKQDQISPRWGAKASTYLRVLDDYVEKSHLDLQTGAYNANWWEIHWPEIMRVLCEKDTREFGPHKFWTSLYVIDLVRLKVYNDLLKHSTGTAILRKVAEALQSTLRHSTPVSVGDSLIKYGGDEFIVLVPEVAHAHSARDMTWEFRKAVANVDWVAVHTRFDQQREDCVPIPRISIGGVCLRNASLTNLLNEPQRLKPDTAVYELVRHGYQLPDAIGRAWFDEADRLMYEDKTAQHAGFTARDPAVRIVEYSAGGFEQVDVSLMLQLNQETPAPEDE